MSRAVTCSTSGRSAATVCARPAIPEDFAYVPAGRFLAGFATTEATELLRPWYKAPPLHQRATGAYAIARRETTFAQYIEFLRALPPDERERRRPRVMDAYTGMSVALDVDADTAVLHLQVGDTALSAAAGQPWTYPDRVSPLGRALAPADATARGATPARAPMRLLAWACSWTAAGAGMARGTRAATPSRAPAG